MSPLQFAKKKLHINCWPKMEEIFEAVAPPTHPCARKRCFRAPPRRREAALPTTLKIIYVPLTIRKKEITHKLLAQDGRDLRGRRATNTPVCTEALLPCPSPKAGSSASHHT